MLLFFFFNDTATTEIYTLSLHDALPISAAGSSPTPSRSVPGAGATSRTRRRAPSRRSEEHTSELQSPCNLVCRLLLEKKKHQRIHTADRLLYRSRMASVSIPARQRQWPP